MRRSAEYQRAQMSGLIQAQVSYNYSIAAGRDWYPVAHRALLAIEPTTRPCCTRHESGCVDRR
jgi:hypothetical protein